VGIAIAAAIALASVFRLNEALGKVCMMVSPPHMRIDEICVALVFVIGATAVNARLSTKLDFYLIFISHDIIISEIVAFGALLGCRCVRVSCAEERARRSCSSARLTGKA
jgi:hypothetical protein